MLCIVFFLKNKTLDDNSDAIGESKALIFLLNAMRKHIKNDILIENGSIAIASIAFNGKLATYVIILLLIIILLLFFL